MNAMIQVLVDSVRLEAHQLRLAVRAIELRSYILDLRERLADTLDVERIAVESPERLPPVWADPDRLERILTNLLSNALKYSPEGSEVTVTLSKGQDEIVTTVTDRGHGIAPADMPRLFGRYYRTNAARLHREGLGLGLYITRLLVEAHGGRIWVESTPGQGSAFHFTLPLGDTGSRNP
jgi:signal transduction histidine kinase